jgi:ComF family protein
MFEADPVLVNRTPGRVELLGQGMTTLLREAQLLGWRLLVPGVCALCLGPGQWRRCRGGLDLCVHCEAALPLRAAGPERIGPGIALLAPFAYRPPADFMVRQLKFAGERGHARTLGLLMAEARRAWPAPPPGLLVPVPLHWQRQRERGFNQARELAQAAGRQLRVPVAARALRRVRATLAQSGLAAAARHGNVRDCFVAHRRIPAGTRVALVDDVLTTGSTALEAARCLRESGVEELEIWVACRAGRPT